MHFGAFKKVGFSRIGKIGGPSPKSLTHKNYTDAILSSESIVDNYVEAFGIPKERMHPIGIPRTDFFFNEKLKKEVKEKIYKDYPILKNKRVILFAPTFRGTGKKEAYYPTECFDIDKIYNNLKENEILIIKNHPFIKNTFKISEEQSKKIIDLSNYNDINNLLLVTDILITDYSSVIFEYALLDKPIIFYMPDMKEYKNKRDFYYDVTEYTYGTVCYNMDELIKNMKNEEINVKKLAEFKEKFLNTCDGNATKRFRKEFFNDNKNK